MRWVRFERVASTRPCAKHLLELPSPGAVLRRKACQRPSGRRIAGDCHVRVVRRKQADRKSISHRKEVWEAALIEGLVTDVPVTDEEGGQILPKGYHVKRVDEP